jgi:hypothetical protein
MSSLVEVYFYFCSCSLCRPVSKFLCYISSNHTIFNEHANLRNCALVEKGFAHKNRIYTLENLMTIIITETNTI